MGNIQITRSEGAVGCYYYNGTFKDSALGPGKKIVCSGDITIVRLQVGRSSQLGAEVTWKVKAGENCPSIGKTFKVNLVEPLPRPNASGDYTSSNANTWLTETAGSGTWPAWRVTSLEQDNSTAARRQTKQFNEFTSRIEIQLLLNSGE